MPTTKLSLPWGLVLPSFTLESRVIEESLLVERDCAASFVFETFTLEAPLGLASVDRRAGWVLSFSRLILVFDCAVVLELRGSDTNGVEPEGRSSEAPSGDPLETCWDFSASFKAWTLVFLGLEMVGERDGDCDWVGRREMVVEDGKVAALICSDSFCFFFLVDGGSDAELRNNDCEGDAVFSLCKGGAGEDDCAGADDTTVTFLLFFDCGLAVIDGVCMDLFPFAGDLVKASAG